MSPAARLSAWALGALALALSACGGTTDRFDLRTPGAKTGDPSVVAAAPPEATPTATPTPKPQGGPVTSEEKRIIRGWSDELRQGHVTAASRYFTIPSVVSNITGGADKLSSRDDVKQFNATLPCGAKLVKTRRSVNRFVVGTFKLSERPGGACGTGTGTLAEVAFLIRHHRINQWVRVADPPQATPTPTPTASADARRAA
jgi:hypothetical protein